MSELGGNQLEPEVDPASPSLLLPPVVPTLPLEVPAPAHIHNQDPQSPDWGLVTKAIVASAFLILAAIAIWRFQFLLSPLCLAAVIAYLLNPIISWLTRKGNISRPKAVLIIYLCLFILLGVGSFFLGVAIAEQSIRYWRNLPEFLPQLVDEAQERAQMFNGLHWTIAGYTFAPGAVLSAVDWEAMARDLANSSRSVVGSSGRWIAGVAGAAAGSLGNTLFVVIVSIYLAIDGPRIGKRISELAHQPGYRRDAERLINDSIKIWNAYLRGQVILGIVIFLVVTLSLTFLGVNNALELGILSGILEFLPIVGPFIGTAAAVIVALLQDGNFWGFSPWIFALIVLGTMIVIQQIENAVLVPRIVGDALDLHPLFVLIGVLMGTSLAGLLGAVLAAPVVATLLLFGNYVWRKMLDLPPFPDDPTSKDQNQERKSNNSFAWLTGIFRSRSPKT